MDERFQDADGLIGTDHGGGRLRTRSKIEEPPLHDQRRGLLITDDSHVGDAEARKCRGRVRTDGHALVPIHQQHHHRHADPFPSDPCPGARHLHRARRVRAGSSVRSPNPWGRRADQGVT